MAASSFILSMSMESIWGHRHVRRDGPTALFRQTDERDRIMLRTTLGLLLLVVLAGSCAAPPPRPDADAASVRGAKLPGGFGDLHRDIGTKVPEAQRHFDQGLRMAYGFNHEAAGRAFAEAARLDPGCAMCLWGQALVLGPNINLPMDPANVHDAATLAHAAMRLAANATPADRALIVALQARYSEPAPADRKPLDLAYADAMAKVAAAFPQDDDATTMYAEALMDLAPWSQWTADGKPTEYTPRVVDARERVRGRNPRQIGAMHYYIHATEAGPDPHRAERYADALPALAPASGHLVHMPAHTYIRLGRYHDATLTNFAATTADKAFLSFCHGSNGVYPLGYVPHNWHFASMTAGLTGSRTLAMQASEQTALRADHVAMGAPPLEFMQVFVSTPLLTQVRFGDWNGILARRQAPAPLPFPTGIWHFSRGMALLRTGNAGDAGRELDALQAIARDPAMAKVSFWDINRADAVLAVAVPLLRGELLRARGDHAGGLAALREAVAAEDKLSYNEPADWPLPARWYLGAALLEAGDAAGAEAAYLQDLKTYPENGWSLSGLAQAQRALGRATDAADAERRLALAWQWADKPLAASRY
jgi:tetratricopeptide (TPR) repeat protein